MKITIGYCVGGADKYYDSLYRSIRSLERIKSVEFDIVVIDSSNKMKSSDSKITIINLPVLKEEINHFQFMRYQLYKYVQTEYTLYLDVDTVISHDNILELINDSEGKFYITQHFWVTTIRQYIQNVGPSENWVKYLTSIIDTPYISSGVFLFNKSSIPLLKDVEDKFNYIYNNDEYKHAITDELVLSTCLQNYEYKLANGAINHCSASYMPLQFDNDILYGKNPYDCDFKPVTVLHGSSIRQHQGEDFFGELQDKVKSVWNI